MQWKKANIESSPAYRAGYITYSTGSSSDQAIVIKRNAKYWVHGKNVDDYYRLIIDYGGSASLCLDGVDIYHEDKSPIWIHHNSTVSLYIASNSSLRGSGSGDAGIQVEPGSTLNVYQESGCTGRLTVDGGPGGPGIGGASTVRNFGTINIRSGNLLVWGDGYWPAIGTNGGSGTINISGGTVETAVSQFIGIGNSYSTVDISGGTILVKTTSSSYSGLQGQTLTISGNPNITIENTQMTSPDLTINGGTINTRGIGGTNTTINGGTITSTYGLSPSTTKITGGTVTISGSSYGLDTKLELSGGVVRATGSYYGLGSSTSTITGGELYLTGGAADMSCSTFYMQGGYVRLEGTAKSLNTGNYNFNAGTLVTANKYATATSCDNFNVQGGSVIVNTPAAGANITNGTSNVYRVKVRGYDLTDNQEYSCTVNGRTFNARLIDGYFHFWMPATTRSVIVNGKSIPIDQITPENDPTWYEDNVSNLKVNKAPLAAWETNGVHATVNRYFDFKSAFAGVSAGNTLHVFYNDPAFFSTAVTSTKNATLDLNGCTLDGTNGLTVSAGILTLTDLAANAGKIVKPVTVGAGGGLRLAGTPLPAVGDVMLDNQKVWWGKVTGSTWNSNLQNMLQGSGRSLTINHHYFIDPDGSMYAWLDNTKNGLTFETSTSPVRYYYTTKPDPVNKHGQQLTADTYKASIETDKVTRFGTLPDAFRAATTGQTIRLLEDFAPVSEVVALTPKAGEVTFDLQGFKYAGTKTLNANGSRLILTSTDGKGHELNEGKLEGTTHLQGLVYSDMLATQLGDGIKRNDRTVYRYFANKMLVSDRVTYAWNSNLVSDEAMIHDDKACLWLPSGNTASGIVSLGYSKDMTTDKCGELLNVPAISTHASSPELVHPYLNLASHLNLANKGDRLVVTHNGVTIDDFLANQRVVVYGAGKTKGITVEDGATVQSLIFRNLNVSLGGSNDYAPLRVGSGSTLNLYLTGENTLQGGGQGVNVKAGIEVAPGGHLHIYNDNSDDTKQNGTGQLFVKGGSHIANAAAGIGGSYGEAAGAVSIHGGTIRAEGGLPSCWGIGNGAGLAPDAVRPEVRILGGSLKTNREWTTDGVLKQPFKNRLNGDDKDLYLMTVNTGLSPSKKYLCTHPGVSDAFPAMTDEYGKYYFWIPELTQENKPTAVFTDPATNNSTTIQLVKIDPNDRNVAPIVCELEVEGQSSVYYNNLKDAFDAVPSDKPTKATIRLLTDIDNLSTTQVVKRGNNVTLNLDRFNLDTKNSNSAGFEAQVGGYLFVTGTGATGTGNIKSTFNISGDIYIAGIVPLTDATPLLNGKAVFRTLVKDLPDNPNNAYTYSYSSTSNRTFYLHDGMACLWLPDASGVLTFRVTQGNNVTEYTAGTITTNTQRTEAMGCQAVGVIARVIKGESVRDFNSLPDAFTVAAETEGNTVQLLANVSLTQPITIDGIHDFTINLNGMTLAASTGTKLTVANGRYLTVLDQNPGMKGSLKMDILLKGHLFVSGNVNQSGNVSDAIGDTGFLWRTLADVSNLDTPPVEVTLKEVNSSSKVLNNEACFWLAEGKTQDFTFVTDKEYPAEDVNINANHQDNLITLGVGNEQARIGTTKYATFAEAWTAALNQGGADIVLLKDATIAGALILNDNKSVSVDVARYTLGTVAESASITVKQGSTLLVNSVNGTGRMLVPIVNQGVLYVGNGIRSDYLSKEITDGTSLLWRTLVSSLPDGMPDDAVYTFTYGNSDPQTGTFYVKYKTACLWLKERKAETLTFGQFNSHTDNVTVEANHANQVIWGQNNVAQVGSTLYSELDKAFGQNRNQAVILLKSAVLKIEQQLDSEMTLKMEGNSVSPVSSDIGFILGRKGSLKVEGTGNITTNFQIIRSDDWRIPGSNTNLAVSADVNLNAAMVQVSTTSYYRTMVTLPGDAEGEMTYTYGDQTGQVKVVKGEALCLWFTAQGKAQELRLTSPDGKIYSATNVLVQANHVNPVTAELIIDEASIDGIYHKTLSDAFDVALVGQTVNLERDLSAMGEKVSIGTAVEGTVLLDLNGHALTGSGSAASLKGNGGKGHLLVKNGTLAGALTVDQNLFVHSDVNLNGLMASDGKKTVWRTLVQLSDVVKPGDEIEYSFGGDKPVKSANIQLIDGKAFACLWLPSSNLARTMVVKAGTVEYALNGVIIASSHGNELDFTSSSEPVAMVGSDGYASLASALIVAAQSGKTVVLQKDITVSTMQQIPGNVTLNLNNKSFTCGNGGFEVADAAHTLTIQWGVLLGTIRLQGKGVVKADATVRIAGFVLDKDNKEVYRTLVKTPDATICYWTGTAGMEYDLSIVQGHDTYEATVPAGLNHHNALLTAYKRIELTGSSEMWQTAYSNTNLVLHANVVFDISSVSAGIIHRLTIRDGARITGSGQVTASDGIRYIRTFATGDCWESVALPFTTVRLTADLPDNSVPAKNVTTLLVPATDNGTSGHFWLKTLDATGRLQGVNSTEMTANVSYLMAVPPKSLENKEITFISGANQLLRRNKVTAVKPASGFASYANGTLDEQSVSEPCYILANDGNTYMRKENYILPPFRGYLLADVSTTTVTPQLRLNDPTAIEPVATGSLKVYGGYGQLIMETDRPVVVSIYTLSGYRQGVFRLTEGRRELSLPAGIYIVNRMKVIVK